MVETLTLTTLCSGHVQFASLSIIIVSIFVLLGYGPSTLLSKLCKLDIPPAVLNWIIAFLTGRSQVYKTSDGRFSVMLPITRSKLIIEGSGVGPTLWLVMASDLHPLSDINS